MNLMRQIGGSLVILSWGNASGIDRSAGVVAIKPSGVPYNKLRVEDIVVLSLATGEVVVLLRHRHVHDPRAVRAAVHEGRTAH